jgi:hypothetical protein
MLVETVEPSDRSEPRVDRAYPQRGEAVGVKRGSCGGVQRGLIDTAAARRIYYRIEKGAAGSPTDVRHALLLDQLLGTVPGCTTWTGSIGVGPCCKAATNLANRNIIAV